MLVYDATIEIDAPIALVWQHLTDFSAYPDWNPFILEAEGNLREGAVVTFRVASLPMSLSAPITRLVPERELTWEARMPMPGLQPRYIRRLEPLDAGRTRFINREEFTGWATTLARPMMNIMLQALYAQTCEALKQRVEAALAEAG